MSKDIPMDDFHKDILASCIAESLAGSGRTQFEFAREGFVGIDNMTQQEFNEAWSYWGGDYELRERQE